MQVDGVVRVHNLRLWSLSVNKNAVSAHLAIGNYTFVSILLSLFCFLLPLFYVLDSFLFILRHDAIQLI